MPSSGGGKEGGRLPGILGEGWAIGGGDVCGEAGVMAVGRDAVLDEMLFEEKALWKNLKNHSVFFYLYSFI